ncbi:MAG: hypothetical protein ACOWYE_18015 [Desulfatiglandales bacterium]
MPWVSTTSERDDNGNSFKIAAVKPKAEQAKAESYEIMVGAAPLSMNAPGMLLPAETDGIVEILDDRSYGEIQSIHPPGTRVFEMMGGGPYGPSAGGQIPPRLSYNTALSDQLMKSA